MEVLRAGHREPRGVSADRPPRRLQARLASSERVRPIAPSLSFQVQLRCSVTVTEPGSWRPPPPSRQQRLPPRRMRLSRGTYLAKCAPGLSCMDFLLVVHPEREKPREQLASSRIPGAQSTNAAQASSPPSPIPPCFSPPFHLPNARRRRAELQQQVQKVRRRRQRRGPAPANLLRRRCRPGPGSGVRGGGAAGLRGGWAGGGGAAGPGPGRTRAGAEARRQEALGYARGREGDTLLPRRWVVLHLPGLPAPLCSCDQ